MRCSFVSFKRAIFGAAVASLSMLVGVSWYTQVAHSTDEPEVDLSLSAFMRKKLDASSQILEGLTTEDARLIQQGAKSLLEMSKAEKWKLLINSDFRSHDVEFRGIVRKLQEAAEKNNFDNAALQWFDATKSCIECHRDVRNASKKK